MPRVGGRRKKTRTHLPEGGAAPGGRTKEEEETQRGSLIVRKGRTTPEVQCLVQELRRLFGPDTASKLRERRYNRVKDYASVAGHLGLTHIITVAQSSASLTLRMGRFPQGPTLTFKVQQYCLQQHVRACQRRPYESATAYHFSPLVVLNNFGDATSPPHVKLMRITFQNLLPALNVNTVKLANCRRVVLFDYDKQAGEVQLRHYAIRAAPAELQRNVKRLVQAKLPNLGSLTDISELLLGPSSMVDQGMASDSEVEDEASQVVLPERLRGRGNLQAQKSAIKLTELGPRLTLRLMKVERGFMEGACIYHDYIRKTPQEVRELEAKAITAADQKKRRREEQEENVARKKARSRPEEHES